MSRELQLAVQIITIELTVVLFPCLAGQQRVRDDIGECKLCSPGRYSTEFTPDFPLSCERCPASTYIDVYGATACKACPLNTYASQPANSIQACLCKPGYYSQYLNRTSMFTIPGTDCVSCNTKSMTSAPLKEEKCGNTANDNHPIGELCDEPTTSICVSESPDVLYWMVCQAYCPGGVIWPLAKAAFFRLEPLSVGGALYKPNIARCDPPEACLPWNECYYKYTGYSCGECSWGFYRDDKSGLCVPCGHEQVIGMVIMAAVCIVMTVGGLFGSALFMRVQADIVFRNELVNMAKEQGAILAKSKAVLTLFRARDKKRVVTIERHDIGSSFRFAKTGDFGLVFRVDNRGQIFVAGLHEDSCVKSLISPHWKIISVNGTRGSCKTEADVKKWLTRSGFPLRFVFAEAKAGPKEEEGDSKGKSAAFDNDRKMFVMLIGVMNAFNQVSMFDFEWPPIFTMLAEYAAQLSLNFNFFKPECSVPTPYNTKWMGFIAIPYIMMIPLTFSYVAMMCYMFPGLKATVLETKKWLLRNAYARTVNMSVILLLPFHLDCLLVPFACIERAEGTYFVSATPDTECSGKDPRYTEMLRIAFIGFIVMTFFYSLLMFCLWKSFYWQFGRARVRSTIPFYVGMVEVSVFGQRGYVKELRDRVMHNIAAVISYDSSMSLFDRKEHLARAANFLGPRSRWVQDAAKKKGVAVELIAGRQDAEEEAGEKQGEQHDKEAVQERLNINQGRQRWIASKFSKPVKDGNVITYGWVLIINLMWRQLLSLAAIKLSAGNLVVVGAAAIMLLHAGNITMLLLFRPYKSRKVTNVETVMLSSLFMVLWCAIIKDLLSNHINVHLFEDTLGKVNTAIDCMAILLMVLVVAVPLYQAQEIATRIFLSMRSTDALLDDLYMTAIARDEALKKEHAKEAEKERIEELSIETGLRLPKDVARKYPVIKRALERINCSEIVVPSEEQRKRFLKLVEVVRELNVDMDKLRETEKKKELAELEDELRIQEEQRMMEEAEMEEDEAFDFEVATHTFSPSVPDSSTMSSQLITPASEYDTLSSIASSPKAGWSPMASVPEVSKVSSSRSMTSALATASSSVAWRMGPLASLAAGSTYKEKEEAGQAKTLTQEELQPKKLPISFGDELHESIDVRSKYKAQASDSPRTPWNINPSLEAGNSHLRDIEFDLGPSLSKVPATSASSSSSPRGGDPKKAAKKPSRNPKDDDSLSLLLKGSTSENAMKRTPSDKKKTSRAKSSDDRDESMPFIGKTRSLPMKSASSTSAATGKNMPKKATSSSATAGKSMPSKSASSSMTTSRTLPMKAASSTASPRGNKGRKDNEKVPLLGGSPRDKKDKKKSSSLSPRPHSPRPAASS